MHASTGFLLAVRVPQDLHKHLTILAEMMSSLDSAKR